MFYPVKLTQADGVYVASCRDIPEFNSVGDTYEEALSEALDGLESALQFYMDEREPIPVPSALKRGEVPVHLPALASVKLALYQVMLAKNVRKADLGRMLHVHAPQVDRLLSLIHQSKLDQVEDALDVLGYRMAVTIEPRDHSARRGGSAQSIC